MPRLPCMSRQEFIEARKAGRKFCWATLMERQDFMLQMSPIYIKPIREITNEPNHHHRAIGKGTQS